MAKDIVISILAARLIALAPWWVRSGWDLVLGLFIAIFIFLLFLEYLYAEYKRYRYRYKKLQERLKKLREMKLDKQEKEDEGSGVLHTEADRERE